MDRRVGLMAATLILTEGIPGSGKSVAAQTIARRIQIPRALWERRTDTLAFAA